LVDYPNQNPPTDSAEEALPGSIKASRSRSQGGKPFARLLPLLPVKPSRFKMPDIMSRLNQTFGDNCHDAADLARGLDESRGEHP